MTFSMREVLIKAAVSVRSAAYAPYSNFSVGAAVLTEDGRIFTGVNVENASYGLAVCAERTAVFRMVTEGSLRISAVAVCSETGGAPCGACRQVLSEFAGDIPVLMIDGSGHVRESTLNALLPERFGPEHLTEKR